MAISLQKNLYGVVHNKTPREVILLNTTGGCSWRLCAFCDYCGTFSMNARQAENLNDDVLAKVQGTYGTLQVLCSANFAELPFNTIYKLREICRQKGIRDLLVETHWMYRESDESYRLFFSNYGVTVHFIYGVETFNVQRRELEWCKGYGTIGPEELAHYADQVNLLIGVRGQTLDGIQRDIIIAQKHFKKVYVYAFEPNDTSISRDQDLMDRFYSSYLFDSLKDQSNIEFLDGLDRRAPDNLGFVGVGPQYPV